MLFVLKLISGDFDIFDSSLVGLFIKKKIKKTRSGFHVVGKRNITIKCSVKCQSLTNPKTRRLQLDCVLMTSLKKASRKKLNPKSNTCFPQSLSNATQNFCWFLAGCVVKNLCQKLPLQWFSCYMILVACSENHVAHYAILVAQKARCDW